MTQTQLRDLGSPIRSRIRVRTRSRGVLYVEYIIVMAFVFIALMVTFYKMGPRIITHFRDAQKAVVEDAP